MTKKEFREAKVGDTVICDIDFNTNYNWLPTKYDIGIITKKEEKSLNVQWENKLLASFWNWYYYEDTTVVINQNISSLRLIIKSKQLELEF